MNQTRVEHFDLRLTIFSGQTFSWISDKDWFYGIFIDSIIKIKQENEILYWQTYPEKDNWKLVENYFGLGQTQKYISQLDKLSDDRIFKQAKEVYTGLRVLNQDFEQTLLSFVLASNKNIPAIRRSINMFRHMAGRSVIVDDQTFNLFPNYEFFYSMSEYELKKAGVGYRAKYMKAIANKLSEGFKNLENEERVYDQLLGIHGVGPKIADCVMTFSLGYEHITPIDRWSMRIIENLYNEKVSNNYGENRRWFTNRFGNGTSLAGQFLFEYVRGYEPDKIVPK